ncbi:UvrD-helicase domain-containing protein [Gilvimarinus sp. F26214L]|uniref:UvrD-helicase domain-containing protein n=1 Tax=Gilvimarinus sp. DZF01 TaxID=3461371 RepID=UPI004045954F
MSIAVPDSAARREALDPTRSFAVSAPAGSGKTGLLTQRVLKLLALCDYPEEVLAITFTRKAAQEMHHRITTALQKAREGQPTGSPHEQLTSELARQVLARDEERGWQLLRSPSRLRIQTIDSFCQSITRQLPIAAGASAYLETRENAAPLYRAAVQELFRQLREDGPLAEAVGILLRHMDNNLPRVENLLVQLLQQRSQWLGPLYYSRGNKHYFEASIFAIVQDTLSRTRKKLHGHLAELGELLRFSCENRIRNGEQLPFTSGDVQLAREDLEPQQALDLWQALAGLCLTNTGGWRKTINNKLGFPAPSSTRDATEKQLFSEQKERLMAVIGDLREDEELTRLLTDIRALPNLAVAPEQWQLLESLTLVLPGLAAIFNLHCSKVGEADFTEVAIAASRALGEEDAPSEIALKLDYRIKHILVDEFQDTSRPQLELLQKLTAGWEAGDGRTLFLVGDAMQSCYGFRDANVGIFIQARTRGIGTLALTPLNLTVNFRSDTKLVEWVNHCFERVFPPRDDINRGAVRYSMADSCGAAATGLIEARGFVGAGEEAQAHYLRDLLGEELESGSGSVAILARSRSHLQDVLRELRSANISWQARDIDALSDRMAVIDLLSLTRALLNLSDRIAWLSILRAPWCGLDLHDLHTLANTRVEENPSVAPTAQPLLWGQILHCERVGLSAPGLALVQRLREVLIAALAQKGRKPLRQWVEGTWLALGGPAAIANPAELHSPQHYFALLDQHARGGDMDDWDDFENALTALYDKSDERSRLQVMTIHKSKGLEFDTVIIPKLNKGTRGDDNPLLLWQEYTDTRGAAHLLISPQGAIGGDGDSLYSYLKRERSLRQEYETARLLYVACTRAISKLYLLMDLERDEKSGELKAPGRGTLAGQIWPILRDQIVLVEEASPSQGGTSATHYVHSHILRLPTRWQRPAWPRDESLGAYRGPASFDDQELPDRSALLARTARYAGTVLHRALRTVCEEGIGQWPPQRVEAQRPLWIQQLRQLGAARTEAVQGAQQVAEAVGNALADPVGRWLLDNRHDESACELALLAGGAGYREAIIDRTFVDEDCRWIIDYKTTTGEAVSDLGMDAFLAQAEAEYSGQLRRYRTIVGKLDTARGRERPIRTALYFPQLKRLHEVFFTEDQVHPA